MLQLLLARTQPIKFLGLAHHLLGYFLLVAGHMREGKIANRTIGQIT